MKVAHQPPMVAKCKDDWIDLQEGDQGYTSAARLIRRICPDKKFYGAIRTEVEKDLLRLSSKRMVQVLVGMCECRTYFLIRSDIAEAWLDFGGREWLLSEIALRSSNPNVVKFKPKIVN